MAKYHGSILGLLCETSMHVGAGQSADVVDLPVAREGATGLPQIPETGVKGALREWATERPDTTSHIDVNGIKTLFGSSEEGSEGGAGVAIFATARLLCLPVRRLDNLYGWMTCPYLLDRLRRDVQRLGGNVSIPDFSPDEETARVVGQGGSIFFEEYVFEATSIEPSEQEKLKDLLGQIVGKETFKTLISRLVIVSNSEFAHFAQNALPVNARNVLGDNKTAINLWYEETMPPDTLLYTLISPRHTKAADEVKLFVEKVNGAFIRFGGNETVGHGWTAVKAWEIGS